MCVHSKRRKCNSTHDSFHSYSEHSYSVARPVAIIFSNTVSTAPMMKQFLRLDGVTSAKEVSECDVFVVGKEMLRRTTRLVLAATLGKDIATTEWIEKSVKANKVLDQTEFLPKSPDNQSPLSFNIKRAIERGKDGQKPLDGYRVLYTQYLRNGIGRDGFVVFKAIVENAGAEFKIFDTAVPKERTLAIFVDHDPMLEYTMEERWTCYRTTMITLV